MIRAIVLRPEDDVAVVTEDVPAGEGVRAEWADRVWELVARQAIPSGHKIAVHTIPQGSPVRKYGEKIGLALEDIQAGDHVHVHNLAGDRVKVAR